jgi:hypothetical protein
MRPAIPSTAAACLCKQRTVPFGWLTPVSFGCTGDYQLRIASLSSQVLLPLVLALTVRSCASGEVVRADTGLNRTQCVRCQPGTYTYNSSQECQICSWDDYAECDGAAKVPMPGFYQSHPRNPQVTVDMPLLTAGDHPHMLHGATAACRGSPSVMLGAEHGMWHA